MKWEILLAIYVLFVCFLFCFLGFFVWGGGGGGGGDHDIHVRCLHLCNNRNTAKTHRDFYQVKSSLHSARNYFSYSSHDNFQLSHVDSFQRFFFLHRSYFDLYEIKYFNPLKPYPCYVYRN